MMLEQIIERLYAHPADTLDRDDALVAVTQLKDLLNAGEVRAAEPVAGGWSVNGWVKKGILLAFRIGAVKEVALGGFAFFDKDTIPLKKLTAEDRVRVVPGGTAIRREHLSAGFRQPLLERLIETTSGQEFSWPSPVDGRALAARLSTAWSTFARTGAPAVVS